MPRMHELSMGLLMIGGGLPDGLRSVDTAVVQWEAEGEVIEKDRAATVVSCGSFPYLTP